MKPFRAVIRIGFFQQETKFTFRKAAGLLFMIGALSFHNTAFCACTVSPATLTVNLGTITGTNLNSIAVGTVLKTLDGYYTNYGANAIGNCGTTTIIRYAMIGVLADGYTNVYATNLRGIGIWLSTWTSGQATFGVGGGYYGTPTTATAHPFGLPVQSITGGGQYGTGYNNLRVELIKTASNWSGGALVVSGPILTITDQTGGAITTMDTLNVSATLSLPTCNVTNTSQTIVLGSVAIKDIVFASPAAAKGFTIDLTCALNPLVTIQFDGLAVVNQLTVLQLRAGPTVATGIGLQILDANKNPVTIGQPVTVTKAATTGLNQFPFTARYVPTDAHRTPGTADAIATFTMQYN